MAGTVAMIEEGPIVEVEGEVRGAAGAGDVDGVGVEVLTLPSYQSQMRDPNVWLRDYDKS